MLPEPPQPPQRSKRRIGRQQLLSPIFIYPFPFPPLLQQHKRIIIHNHELYPFPSLHPQFVAVKSLIVTSIFFYINRVFRKNKKVTI